MISLHALLEHVRQVLALNFPTPITLVAEVAQVKQSRGHYYFDLIEKNSTDGAVIAQVSGVMWGGMYKRLRQQVGPLLDDLMQAGLEIQLQVRIDFHERYGLKLYIEGIDPNYTMGKLAVQRQETLQKLAAENLLQRNREQTSLPVVVQRVAVISSSEAAGLQDFMIHINENAYGYRYQVSLFQAAMQGQHAAAEIAVQIAAINLRATEFDCIVMVRGGGARLDLQAFDELVLCRAIAHASLPVLCGIGHDIDQSVADIVCFASLKTPTATADFLIAHHANFEAEVQLCLQQIRQTTAIWMQQQNRNLGQLQREIKHHAQTRLRVAYDNIIRLQQLVKLTANNKIRQENQQIEKLTQLTAALHPKATFARGYSLTTHNNQVLTSEKQVNPGDILTTHLQDGQIISTTHAVLA